MQNSREFKIGVLVLLGGILLVLGVNFLKGFNPLGSCLLYTSPSPRD